MVSISGMDALKSRIDELVRLLGKGNEALVNREAVEEQLAQLIDTELPCTRLGPTWETNPETGKKILPEHSLGWEIAVWCHQWLRAFDPEDEDDQRGLTFTKEQLRFLLWWYAVDDDGDFIFTMGVLQRLKGWGKDPFLAAIALVEWVGPCRFSHWDIDAATGEKTPVAKPVFSSLVQIAAVTQDQTTNTSDMFPVIMTDRFKKRYKVRDGIELIRANGGRAKIRMVTSNPKALEGKRSTFVVMNETQWWDASNNGHGMYGVIEGNVSKLGGSGARYLTICNAFIPGGDSVGERLRVWYDDIAAGKKPDIGFLYDTIEAHPLVPMHPVALNVVIPKIRGDAVWLSTKSILRSMANEVIPMSESRRKWLNQVVAEEDQLYDLALMLGLHCDDYLKPGDEIVLGFDGGRTDDSSALIALRVSDCLAVPLGIWEKPDMPGASSRSARGDDTPGWQVDHAAVNAKVAEAFNTYKVVGFYSDVREWESFVLNWGALYGERLLVKSRNSATSNPVAWDMRISLKASTYAHQRLVQSLWDGHLRWTHQNGKELAETFRRHILNVYRDENDFGVYFRKEARRSSRKIDAYAALMLAHECRNDYLIRGQKTETSKSNRVWFMR